MSAHDWLVPDWPAPQGVHALCTTRSGGISAAPFDSLNLGDHVGDDAAAVAANRARLQAALHAVTPGARPVFLQQVHGAQVLALGPHTPQGLQADACTSMEPGAVCTVMVADCLPLLFALRDGSAVAAAHAGWRGLAGGVVEATLAALQQAGRGQAGDVLAWLGPCIGPGAFEVGADVLGAFAASHAEDSAYFVPHAQGKYLADLAGLARVRLRRAGVLSVHGNDSSAAWCTVSQPSRFFSRRRDAVALGGSGRFAACIWRG